jgi:hypothetical protein
MSLGALDEPESDKLWRKLRAGMGTTVWEAARRSACADAPN